MAKPKKKQEQKEDKKDKKKSKKTKRSKKKTKKITIKLQRKRLDVLFGKFKIKGASAKFRFEGLAKVRKLLADEKLRILQTIKQKQPDSLYQLAKLLDRDLKSVRSDIEILKNTGFIKLVKSAQKTKDQKQRSIRSRIRLRTRIRGTAGKFKRRLKREKGLRELMAEQEKQQEEPKRIKVKPVIATDNLQITIKI